jgi:hypothetical protein
MSGGRNARRLAGRVEQSLSCGSATGDERRGGLAGDRDWHSAATRRPPVRHDDASDDDADREHRERGRREPQEES